MTNINLMIINGNRLELPTDIVFKNYPDIKKTLTKAGGKYKNNGFEFQVSAEVIKTRLTNGEKIDDKKKFQFFPTPHCLARDLVDYACIDENMSVLEPSAGNGSIAKLIRNDARITVVEIDESHVGSLSSITSNVNICDFMDYSGLTFDRIVANPPFTKNQDIDHVIKMYELLNCNGRIVSVMSNSWRNGSQKKQINFRNFIDSVGGEIIDIDAGVFRESGTNIATCVVIINKP